MKFVSKLVDYSPMLDDGKERIEQCVEAMGQEGYNLMVNTPVDSSRAVLVFTKECA